MHGNIMMVGNFSSSTGYAWNMIGSCFVAVGKEFRRRGNQACVCFPKVDIVPIRYSEADIEVVEFDFAQAGIMGLYSFLAKRKIKYVYLIDRSPFSFKYVVMRLAGVCCLIVHDHTSGSRCSSGFVKVCLKFVLNRSRLFSADHIIAISNFVKQRAIDVSRVPSYKVSTIVNGVNVDDFVLRSEVDIYKLFGIKRDRKIIFCGCRANFYKGIDVFVKTANELVHNRNCYELFFLYCGDGPDLARFQSMIHEFKLDEYFYCSGKVDKINRFLGQVFVSVVPSVWQEGFGMTVIEAMAAGVPVIASRVGGMSEIMDDGIDGFYVEPGSHKEIADIVERLVLDDELRVNIVQQAQQRVRGKYTLEQQHMKIADLFRSCCVG